MKPFPVTPFLKKRFQKMERHYGNLLDDFELEEIHQFRVQIKRIKAFVSLLNADRSKRKKLRLPKSLSLFYQTVGELRNLQLQQQEIYRLFENMHLVAPMPYLLTLSKKKDQLKVRARTRALEQSLSDCCRKLINKAPRQLSRRDIEEFAVEWKYRLLKLLQVCNLTDDVLHGVRKRLKDVVYLWRWVKHDVRSLLQMPSLNKKTYLALTEELGDLQNQRMMLRSINGYAASEQLTDDEGVALFKLSEFLRDSNQRLKQSIVGKLTDYFNVHIRQERFNVSYEEPCHLRF